MGMHFEDYCREIAGRHYGELKSIHLREYIADFIDNECSKAEAIDFVWSYMAEIDGETLAANMAYALRTGDRAEFGEAIAGAFAEHMEGIVRTIIEEERESDEYCGYCHGSGGGAGMSCPHCRGTGDSYAVREHRAEMRQLAAEERYEAQRDREMLRDAA